MVLSAVVALGFVLFAIDELDRGSKTQQQAIDQGTGTRQTVVPPAPTPEEEVLREKQHGAAREAIDDANDLLLSPFSGVVTSKNHWVTHGIPALIALFVYGLGLGLLANVLPKPTPHARDWRTAA